MTLQSATLPLMSLLPLLLFVTVAATAGAQPACRTRLRPFDGAGEIRRRADELTTGVRAGLGILRSPVTCITDGLSNDVRSLPLFNRILPDIRLGYAGGLPDSRGDGSLWSGRGTSVLIRGGFSFDWRFVHLAAVPELWYSANHPFDVLPGLDSTRSSLASPFYAGDYSLDYPSRMGRLPVAELSAGQSALWISAGPVDIGWSAGNIWWGAGVRDALFLGPTAPGIPRLFARTPRAIETVLGKFSGEYFLGILTESRFFDRDANNDRRSLTAGAITWSPRNTDAAVVGIARGIARLAPPDAALAGRVGDVFLPVGIGDGDQLVAFFARYALPRSGLRAYLELARARTTNNPRDILTVPSEGLAYQVGVEQLIRRPTANWMFLFEAMNLEQGVDVVERPPRDFYSGEGTPHGWTQRGQLLGAGIGPGSQSQWISADRIAPTWSAGVYTERVRWNNDALFRQYLPYANRHDVSVRLGARGSFRRMGYDIVVDASIGNRLNYLFQNNEFIPSYRTVDVSVPQLRLTLSPVVR